MDTLLNSSAGAAVYLRELEPRDLVQLNRWRNDPELLSHLGSNFLFIAEAVDDEWYKHYLSQRDRAIRLAIVETGSDRYIGNASLTSIHPINRSAEYSMMIGPRECRNKGYGVTITRSVLSHAFNDRGLNRVYCSVISDNTASIRMVEKSGFVQEGVCRQALFKNGRFHDVMMMAALRETWR